MGRKQKLKLQRRLEEKNQMIERKEGKKKTVITSVIIILSLIAGYQISIAMKNKNNISASAKNEINGSSDDSRGKEREIGIEENKATNESEIVNNQEEENKKIASGENKTEQEKTSEEAIITENQKNRIAIIETGIGNIKLELFSSDAPKTAENFVKLANEKFYDGTKFHRVISDFMIQGGDPLSKDSDPSNDGSGGPGYAFEDEIDPWDLGVSEDLIKLYESQGYNYDKNLNSHQVDVGSLAMANSGPNTNGSQFFIVTEKPQPHLNGKHTVFGKVLEGMDVVKNIRQEDVMKRVYIAE